MKADLLVAEIGSTTTVVSALGLEPPALLVYAGNVAARTELAALGRAAAGSWSASREAPRPT